jgi:hypothetical protein
MNDVVDQTARRVPVGWADTWAFVTFEESQPIVQLVAGAFLLALILLVPAVLEAVVLGCPALRFFVSRNGRRPLQEGGLHVPPSSKHELN